LDGVSHGIAKDTRPGSRTVIGHIGLWILSEHFQFLSVAQIHPHKSSRIGLQRGMNDQALALRREPGDERSADDLPVEERLLEGHTTRSRHGLSTASRTRMSVFPLFPSKAVAARMTKSLSVVHVRTSPWIGRLERDGARFEIDAIHVEGLRVAAVQGNEDKLRMLQVGQDILRTHAGERGQIAHLVVRQVAEKR
jgi:Zn/Cd-binding protein ZinT